LVQQIAADVTHAAVADARDKEVLKALGAKDFDCAVVGIGGSLADSVLATMNLKELGVPRVVCKAHDETHRQVLLKLGADQVVIPEQENAARLARSLSSHNVLDYIELSEDYGIIEVPAPKSWLGKSLRQLNVRAKLGVNIIAIKSGSDINVSPAADYEITAKDVMVVLGDSVALKEVQKL
jgi:trk system potassium uptake protein TrkA